MLLDRTIAQLDVGHVDPEQAESMGHLGYMQWLGALKGDASYKAEAMTAYVRARPLVRKSPAIAIFCDLLLASCAKPLRPLELNLPVPARRGGAKARRSAK